MSAKRHPPRFLFNLPAQDRACRVQRALHDAYPGSISAKQLMGRSGHSWQSVPVSSFVSLCNDFIILNQELAPLGWKVEKSDGTPDAICRLSPIGDG